MKRQHRAHLLSSTLHFASHEFFGSRVCSAAASRCAPSFVCVVVSSSSKLLPRQQQPNLNFIFRFPTFIPSHARFCSSTSPSPFPLPFTTPTSSRPSPTSSHHASDRLRRRLHGWRRRHRPGRSCWYFQSPFLAHSPSTANMTDSPRYQHLHRD